MPLYVLETIMAVLALVLLALVLRIFGVVASLKPLARLPGWIAGQVRHALAALRHYRAECKAREAQVAANLAADPAELGRRRSLEAEKRRDGHSVWGHGTEGSEFAIEVQNKLEIAFDLFERGRISLETYQAMLAAEHEATLRQLGEIELDIQYGMIEEPAAGEAALAEARELIAAVEWCIDWARSLAAATASGAPA